MPSPWVERTFPHGAPFAEMRARIDRLRAFPERALELLLDVPPDRRTQRIDGAWSPLENLGHLLDLEPLGERRLDELLRNAAALSPADMGNRRTHEANHNASALEDLIARWRRERESFAQRLEGLDEAAATWAAMHPRLRVPMSAVDLAHFIAEHDEHHLSRIEEQLVRHHTQELHLADARDADIAGIAAIYNDVIATSTAVYGDQPVSLANRREWWEDRVRRGYPVLVARRGSAVLGFASFGDFRTWPGYRFTVEHTVHVASSERGSGIGARLVRALFPRAKLLGKHMLIAGADGENVGSIRFHERLGFTLCGRLREVGFKFGRRLDLVFLQRPLD